MTYCSGLRTRPPRFSSAKKVCDRTTVSTAQPISKADVTVELEGLRLAEAALKIKLTVDSLLEQDRAEGGITASRASSHARRRHDVVGGAGRRNKPA